MEASEQKQPVAPASSPSAPARPKSAEDEAERYDAEGWRERVRRFGQHISPHALAGAFHGVESGERLTEQEVRERLEAFHRRESVERPEEPR